MSFLFTNTSNVGHTITVAAPGIHNKDETEMFRSVEWNAYEVYYLSLFIISPKNATLAGLVSTKLNDCVIYPNEVKQPQSNACGANFPSNLNKNGDSAKLAINIRAEVAALGGNESFIIAPNGKLVPYKIDANASNIRGPR